MRQNVFPPLAATLLAGAIALYSIAPAAGKQAYTPSLSDYGGIGLLQMRNARFADDGGLVAGYSFVDPYERFYLTL